MKDNNEVHYSKSHQISDFNQIFVSKIEYFYALQERKWILYWVQLKGSKLQFYDVSLYSLIIDLSS